MNQLALFDLNVVPKNPSAIAVEMPAQWPCSCDDTEIEVPVPVGCGYPCLPPREPCKECITYWAAIGREKARIEAERSRQGVRSKNQRGSGYDSITSFGSGSAARL